MVWKKFVESLKSVVFLSVVFFQHSRESSYQCCRTGLWQDRAETKGLSLYRWWTVEAPSWQSLTL